MSIIDDLDDLSPEELEVMAKVISKLAQTKKGKTDKTSKDKKMGKSSPKKRVVKKEQEQEQEDISEAPVLVPIKSRTKKETHKNTRNGRTAPLVQSYTPPKGPNKFLSMPEYKSEKQDTRIDKLLWKGNQPTERRDEIEFIDAECRVCGKVSEVSPALTLKDIDTGEVMFTCNRCIKRGATDVI